MKKRIFLLFLFLFTLYLIRIGYVIYKLENQRKIIFYSIEGEPLFYNQVKFNSEVFYPYSKISFLILPIRLSFFQKIHSKFIEWFYPEFLLKKLTFQSDYFQFYPGFEFLNCSENLLIKEICIKNKTFEIQTEINKNLEKKIIKIIEKEIKPLKNLGAEIGSVVILERKKNHNVLRVITNNTNPYIDTFTKIRLAGSTLKPFLYALSFEKLKYEPTTIIEDEPKSYWDPITQQIYIPRNHDNLFMGKITIREALANSRNIPAIEILNRIGIENFINFFKNIGIEHYEQSGLSLALGTGGITQIQLTILYSILANEGFLKPLIFGYLENQPMYLTTEHKFQTKEPEIKKIFFPETVKKINSILQDNEIGQFSFGKRNPMNFIYSVSSKTGTSRQFRDSWIAGIIEDYIITVWVGKIKEEPMYGISGVKGAGKIFHQIVRLLKPNKDFLDENQKETFYKKHYDQIVQNKIKECKILHPYDEQIFFLNELQRKYQRVYIKINCNEKQPLIKIYKDHKEIHLIKHNENQTEFFLSELGYGDYNIEIITKEGKKLDNAKFYIK